MKTILLCFLLATVQFAVASWREDHHVEGLPVIDNTNIKSYAGVVPVRKDDATNTESGLFYWFFEAQQPNHHPPPLILWFQGGPGSSSGVGLFYELLGPYILHDNLTLENNPHTWTRDFDVLFVDNPVGTGYSYVDPPAQISLSHFEKRYLVHHQSTDDPETLVLQPEFPDPDPPKDEIKEPYDRGYATNQDGVAADMMAFIHQFYDNFPEKRKSDLYIASESYGGKYAPSIATAILDYNQRTETDQIPLKGLSIGNQWTDPNTQILAHAPLAFYLGLIDETQSHHLDEIAREAVKLNLKGDTLGALAMRLKMFDKFSDYTGKLNWYDIRQLNRMYSRSNMKSFFNNNTIKSLLHVPQHIEFTTNDPVIFYFLKADIMRSTVHLFPRLLSNLKVLLYQGQFDFRDGAASQTKWLSDLPWVGMPAFKEASRKPWYNDHGLVSGYVTQSSNLTRVVLSNAGHMSPGDSPEAALTMIKNFIEEREFKTTK